MSEHGKSDNPLIEQIDALSGHNLTYKNELALLIDLANQHQQMPSLAQLSFFGKFVHKSSGILQRTGADNEDNQRLAKEFEESIEKVRNLLHDILACAAPDALKIFNREFLEVTPDAFGHLLILCKDLSWYKNYLIDTRRA